MIGLMPLFILLLIFEKDMFCVFKVLEFSVLPNSSGRFLDNLFSDDCLGTRYFLFPNLMDLFLEFCLITSSDWSKSPGLWWSKVVFTLVLLSFEFLKTLEFSPQKKSLGNTWLPLINGDFIFGWADLILMLFIYILRLSKILKEFKRMIRRFTNIELFHFIYTTLF